MTDAAEWLEVIRQMVADGYLEYNPDDLEKPEGERRLLTTEKGERDRRQVEARLAQKANAHLS